MNRDSEFIQRLAQENEALYARGEGFLRYPADWVMRFHHMYLKSMLPAGSAVLDFGCGSGNHSAFFTEAGYEVQGIDIAPSFKQLVRMQYEKKGLPWKESSFHVLSPGADSLPYPDARFDFILANQVLYYLPSAEYFSMMMKELYRISRPGGLIFASMIGPPNDFISRYGSAEENGLFWNVSIEDEGHRLKGLKERLMVIAEAADLPEWFSGFVPLHIGHFELNLMDLHSNFHYLYVGKRPQAE